MGAIKILPPKKKDRPKLKAPSDIAPANVGEDSFSELPAAPGPSVAGTVQQEASPQEEPEYIGLQSLQNHQGGDQASAGQFEVPPQFDRVKFSARYVQEGASVDAAKQREYLTGVGKTADGFSVWKDGNGAPHKVTVSSGTFVLMYRPKQMEALVNKAFGQLSRSRMQSESRGETIGGTVNADSGMLNDDRLRKEIGVERDLESERDSVIFNASGQDRAERPSQVVSR